MNNLFLSALDICSKLNSGVDSAKIQATFNVKKENGEIIKNNESIEISFVTETFNKVANHTGSIWNVNVIDVEYDSKNEVYSLVLGQLNEEFEKIILNIIEKNSY